VKRHQNVRTAAEVYILHKRAMLFSHICMSVLLSMIFSR